MQTGKEVILPWYGCKGMRDVEYGNRDPEYASWLQNLFPVDPVNGGPVAARPGFTLFGGTFPWGATALPQLLYTFELLSGTTYLVAVVAGEIYRCSSVMGTTWSKVVTSANLATAGVTLSTSANPIYAVTYNDTMVISDGVNVPFTWDSTSGAGGLVSLTNAPVAYGRPTVYYAKLVFIKNTERNTFVWSEENAANTGYEAGGYLNAWTLGQNGSAPLSAIFGTNNALYYSRPRSIGGLLGAVNTDFQ